MSVAGARILITGGHGFVGGALVRYLAARGAELWCPYRPGASSPSLPGTVFQADLRDPGALDDSLPAIDLVVHMAARSGGIQFQHAAHEEVLAENTAVTRHVLGFATRTRVRRVFLASSGVVYAGSSESLLAEESPIVAPPGEVSGYAWSKLTDELLGRWTWASGGPEVVVGRFANVYGPGGSFDPARSTVVHALVRKAVEARDGRLEVWGDGTAVRSFLHVDDAARAIVTILEHGEAGGTYNCDASEPVSIAQLAGIVRDAVDPTLALVFDPSRASGPSHRVLDTARLRSLGFAAEVRLSAGVAAVVDACPGR